MIQGYCHSNNNVLKKFRWPKEFTCRPQAGDWVESICGKRQAQVGRIVHTLVYNDRHSAKDVPALSIELINPFGPH